LNIGPDHRDGSTDDRPATLGDLDRLGDVDGLVTPIGLFIEGVGLVLVELAADVEGALPDVAEQPSILPSAPAEIEVDDAALGGRDFGCAPPESAGVLEFVRQCIEVFARTLHRFFETLLHL
jgi:hypothetical protein